MKINFTKKQFESLIKAVATAGAVYGFLGDCLSDDIKKQSTEISELGDYLLGFAHEFDMGEVVQTYKGKTIMDDQYFEKIMETMDEYDELVFWNELEVRLGKRDFERTKTKQEIIEIQKNGGWLPERVHDIYEKWSVEFEEHGLDRLNIVKE